MSTELVPQDDLTGKALAIQAEAHERKAALKELGISTDDLVIPSIQFMQNTSALVSDGKAKLGDIVNMQTEEILGGFDKPVKILPLKLFKTLRIYDVTDGFKFLREEPLTAQNENLPWEGHENDLMVKRMQTINAFILLKTDLQREEGFPCLIRFKSTGMNAGRALATHLYKVVYFRKKPYSQFMEISTRKEKKDTNSYAVPSAALGKDFLASEAEMKVAEDWLSMLAASQYVTQDDELETHGKPVVLGGSSGVGF